MQNQTAKWLKVCIHLYTGMLWFSFPTIQKQTTFNGCLQALVLCMLLCDMWADKKGNKHKTTVNDRVNSVVPVLLWIKYKCNKVDIRVRQCKQMASNVLTSLQIDVTVIYEFLYSLKYSTVKIWKNCTTKFFSMKVQWTGHF